MTQINQFAVKPFWDWSDKKSDVCVQFRNGKRLFIAISHSSAMLNIRLIGL